MNAAPSGRTRGPRRSSGGPASRPTRPAHRAGGRQRWVKLSLATCGPIEIPARIGGQSSAPQAQPADEAGGVGGASTRTHNASRDRPAGPAALPAGGCRDPTRSYPSDHRKPPASGCRRRACSIPFLSCSDDTPMVGCMPEETPSRDNHQLSPAATEDVVQALSFALRYRGRKRVDTAVEAMARITAERLTEHLARSGFVVMKKPPPSAHGG